jgi:hypothetical protein
MKIEFFLDYQEHFNDLCRLLAQPTPNGAETTLKGLFNPLPLGLYRAIERAEILCQAEPRELFDARRLARTLAPPN